MSLSSSGVWSLPRSSSVMKKPANQNVNRAQTAQGAMIPQKTHEGIPRIGWTSAGAERPAGPDVAEEVAVRTQQ